MTDQFDTANNPWRKKLESLCAALDMAFPACDWENTSDRNARIRLVASELERARKKSLGLADERDCYAHKFFDLRDALLDLTKRLRSTPTAPTRTEEKRFVSGSHVYKHYGVEESPDAEGSEGPSDAAPPEFTAAVGVVQVAWARKVSGPEHFAMVAAFEAGRSSAAREFIDPREVTSVIDGYFPGRVRHSSVAANVLWHLHEVLAEKDRDLAEAKSQLLAQGRIASDLYRSSQAQSGATATLAAEKDRELAEFREAHIDCSEVKLALSAIVDEKDRELAELREKVKAYEAWLTEHGKEVASELYSAANKLERRHSGYDYGPRVAWLREAGVELDSVVKAHLRPGSGSDEGKATT